MEVKRLWIKRLVQLIYIYDPLYRPSINGQRRCCYSLQKLANLTIDDIDSSMHNSIVDDLDGKDAQVGDLFSAHDFDIKLDLDAKLPRKLSNQILRLL